MAHCQCNSMILKCHYMPSSSHNISIFMTLRYVVPYASKAHCHSTLLMYLTVQCTRKYSTTYEQVPFSFTLLCAISSRLVCVPAFQFVSNYDVWTWVHKSFPLTSPIHIQLTLDITSTRYSESLYIVNIFQKTNFLLHKPLSI